MSRKLLLFSIVLILFGTMDIQAQSDNGSTDYMYGVIASSQKNYATAIKHYQKAIDKGHPEAIMAMGDLYSRGNGVAQNTAEAINWYQKGIDRYTILSQSGDMKAIAKLSDLYFLGEKFEKDYAEALKYTLQKGTEMSKWDMQRIGYIYENGGNGVSKDLKKATEWYLKAYDNGYDVSSALRRIGVAIPEKLSAEDDYARRLAKAATEPNPSDYRGIAMEIYAKNLKDEGVTAPAINQKIKEKLLQMADIDFYGAYLSIVKALGDIPTRELVAIFTPEQQKVIKDIASHQANKTSYPASAPPPGMPWAMRGQQSSRNAAVQQTTTGKEEFDKGFAFYKQENFEEAIIWFKKSAEKGQSAAMHNLGTMYMKAQGVQKDMKEAFKWFKQAAEKGNTASMVLAGAMSFFGEGIEKNSSEAFVWFKEAVDAGIVDPTLNELLGLSYEHGLGTKQNYTEAEKCFLKAIEIGNETAATSLNLLRKNKNKLSSAKSAFVNSSISEELISFEDNKRYGLKDKNGKIIVPPKYDNLEPIKFAEGLARVQFNGKWGFINPSGKEIISPKYDQTTNFWNGVATVKSGENWGVVDKTGREIVPPKYFEIRVMMEELMAVNMGGTTKGLFTEGGKWGFIDKTGKEVIPLQYNDVGSFSDGLASVEINGKKGYIDRTGRQVISPKYTLAYSFNEGLAKVQLDRRWGFINTKGEEVIPFIYDDVQSFSEGMASFQAPYIKERKFKKGYINTAGKEIVPARYDVANDFSEGTAAVGIGKRTVLGKFNGKMGFIDKSGKEVIPLRYDDVGKFSEGLAAVKLSDKWGFIDKNGIVIIPLEYSAKFIYIGYATPAFKNGLAEVVKDGKIVAIDKAGRIVTELGIDSKSSVPDKKTTDGLKESMERINQARKEAAEKIKKSNEETKKLLEEMKK